jgi:hypothetical protein
LNGRSIQSLLVSPIGFITIFVFFYYPLKQVIILNGLSRFPTNFFEQREHLFLIIYSFLFFLYGWLFLFTFINLKPWTQLLRKVRRLFLQIEKRVIRPNKSKFIISLIFLNFIILGSYFFASYLSFDFIYLTSLERKLAAKDHILLYLFIKGTFEQLSTITAFFLFYYWVTKNLNWYFIVLWLLCTIIFIWLTGVRGALITKLFIPFTVVYLVVNTSMLRFFTVALGAFFLLFFIGVLGILRSLNSDEFTVSSVMKLIRKSDEILLAVISRRLDGIFPNSIYALEWHSNQSLRFGFDYGNILLQFIPRGLWSDKPITLTRTLNNELQIQSVGGTGFGAFVESFMNFGMIGILVHSFIAALILKSINKLYWHAIELSSPLLLSFVYTFGLSLSLRLVITPGITHNPVELIVMLINFSFAIFLMLLLRRI